MDSHSVESTLGNLDAAESFLLRMTPIQDLAGKMPSVEAHVYRVPAEGRSAADADR